MKRDPNCQLCSLCQEAHHLCLWGTGNPHAKLMLIGEAPGASEDRLGKPFSGEAGRLLNHILDKLTLKREDIYITNCLKCRPPSNKLPKAKELKVCWEACHPYLEEELATVNPKAILLLGNTPLFFLTGKRFITRWESLEVGKDRGRHIFASFHPAYALRSPRVEKNIGAAIYLAAKAAGLKPVPKGKELFTYEIRG